jgi:hypothetical protein
LDVGEMKTSTLSRSGGKRLGLPAAAREKGERYERAAARHLIWEPGRSDTLDDDDERDRHAFESARSMFAPAVVVDMLQIQ